MDRKETIESWPAMGVYTKVELTDMDEQRRHLDSIKQQSLTMGRIRVRITTEDSVWELRAIDGHTYVNLEA